MKMIFYLDTSNIERIREKPSIAWNLFPSTKIELWEIPEVENDLENLWEVECIPCYSAQYFCMLVKIDQTDMKALDRAYQHGGGFVFQLAQPRDDNELTDVFTVFGTSPLEEREEMKWSRFFVYYKDIDLVFKKIEDAEIAVEIDDKYTYMLAMAPWYYAEPLSPFRTKEIGFNIIVPQPIESQYPVQYYSLIPGWKIMSEQDLRDYVVYELEEPNPPAEGLEIDCNVESKHYQQGTPASVFLSVNASDSEEMEVSIENDGKVLTTQKFPLSRGINHHQLEFDTRSLDPGHRQLSLILMYGESHETFDLEILVLDPEKLLKIRERVSALSDQDTDDLMMKESLVTVEWQLERLTDKLNSLKPHQAPWHIQDLIGRLERDMKRVESGESLFIQGEPLRMGFKSRQDSTLQHYSMYIPPTFEEGTSGLFVMLHGSGTDDERTLKKIEPFDKYDATKMILVAPFARGESHMYLPEEAIEDIIEVTEKISKLFAIPKEKIVIGGFSMGGLGVIGSFLKRPDLYHNLMIISGAMKGYDGLECIIDYTTEESLQKLAQTDLIIFHGAEDRNVNYVELKPIHDRLLELNPDIEIHIADGFGHQLSPDWDVKMTKYFERIVQKS